MANYRNGNYSAFYVAEPFKESNLGANAARDFVYYNMLRAWKGKDASFPFNDSHDKTYNVRDGSDWESTLKPRLHERLRNSKNIVLFLSSVTYNSRALREEIEYGIGILGLPVIVVYPDYSSAEALLDPSKENLNNKVTTLWNKLPRFRDLMSSVPTLHVPMSKEHIKRALEDEDLMVQSKKDTGCYHYKR